MTFIAKRSLYKKFKQFMQLRAAAVVDIDNLQE